MLDLTGSAESGGEENQQHYPPASNHDLVMFHAHVHLPKGGRPREGSLPRDFNLLRIHCVHPTDPFQLLRWRTGHAAAGSDAGAEPHGVGLE